MAELYPSLKKMQKISVSIVFSDTETTKDITAPTSFTALSDINKTVLFWSESNEGELMEEYGAPLVRLLDIYTIRVERGGGTGRTIKLEITLMEFYQGVTVQHFYDSNVYSTATDLTIKNVETTTNTFIIPSFASQDTTYFQNSTGTFSLSNTTTVRFTPAGASCYPIAMQIVQWGGAFVQTITDNIDAGSTSKSITIPLTVDLSKTIIIASMSCGTNASFQTRHVPNIYIANANTINVDREIAGYQVDFVANIITIPQFRVQRGTKNLGSTETTTTIVKGTDIGFNSEVWADRSFSIIGQLGGWSRNSCTGSSYGKIFCVRGKVNSSTQITLTRQAYNIGLNNYVAIVNWQLIEYTEQLRIKRIQRGSESFSAITTDKTVTVPYSYEPRKSILSYTAVCNDTYAYYYHQAFTIDSVSSTQISLKRCFSSYNDFTVYWEIVEFESGLKVQRGYKDDPGTGLSTTYTFNVNDTNLTYTDWTDSVDITRSFVLSTVRGDPAYSGGCVPFYRYSLGVSSALTFDRGGSLPLFGVYQSSSIHFQIVEIDHASVQTLTGTISGALTSYNMSLSTSVTTNSSFLTMSWGVSTTDTKINDLNNPVFKITDSSTVTMQRASTYTDIIYAVSVISINSPSFINVQRGQTSFGTSTSSSVTINSVDTSKTFISLFGHSYGWAPSDSYVDLYSYGFINNELFYKTLTNSTTVTFTRSSTTSRSPQYVNYEVLEINPDSTSTRNRRCPVTINNTQVSSNESNFPVLLKWTGTQSTSNLPQEMFNLDGGFAANPNGGDILVTSDFMGTTLLPIEIVRFKTDIDPANGYAEIYVKVPNISTSSSTTIYVWYNVVPTNSTYIEQPVKYQPSKYLNYGQYAVWSNGYAYVAHVNYLYATEATVEDATGNTQTLGTPTSRVSLTSGKIGNAASIPTGLGANSISWDSSVISSKLKTDNLLLPSTDGCTFEWWVYPLDDWDQLSSRVYNFSFGYYANHNWAIYADPTSDSITFETLYQISPSYQWDLLPSDKILWNATQWYHLAINIEPYSGGGNYTWVIDGSAESSHSYKHDALATTTPPLKVGSYYDNTAPVNGYMDEIRISETKRTNGWVISSYRSQNSPETFTTLGSPSNRINSTTSVIILI